MAIEANVGARVGNYILVRKLGEGGMAEVWLARQHASATFRALKFLNAQFQGIPEVETRFQSEGENQLVHPNIVRIYEVGQEGGHSFLVMDYIDGRDLEKIMDSRRGPLTIPEAVDIGIQILEGLGFAHASGIVHRDIKPSNVLVDSEHQAYLMDFGIAKVLKASRNMTQVGSRLGTPDYMSPEQIRSPRDVDSRSDIYSFGCLFYELLTGWPPFDRNAGYESEHDVRAAHLREPAIPPMQRRNGLPMELDGIALHCLAKAKEDRPQSCQEIIAALQAYQASVVRTQQAYQTIPVKPLGNEPPKSTPGPGSWPVTQAASFTNPLAPPAFPSKEPPPLPLPAKPFAEPVAPAAMGAQVRTPTIADTPWMSTPTAPPVLPGPLSDPLPGLLVDTARPVEPPAVPAFTSNTGPKPLIKSTQDLSVATATTTAAKTRNGSQRWMIGAGSLLLLLALGGGGWVVWRETKTTDTPNPPVKKEDNPPKVDPPQPHSTVPDKKPDPVTPDHSTVLPPGPGKTPDHKPVIKIPGTIVPKVVPASGTIHWTGTTNGKQKIVTIFMANQAASVGSVTVAGFAPRPMTVSVTSGNAQVLVQPSQKTNYSTFLIYVAGDGDQDITMKWTEVQEQ